MRRGREGGRVGGKKLVVEDDDGEGQKVSGEERAKSYLITTKPQDLGLSNSRPAASPGDSSQLRGVASASWLFCVRACNFCPFSRT